MLTLVGYPISPYVRKVRLVLEHKNLAYQLDPLNPFSEKQRLLKLNPRGQVPVLGHDDKWISDSSRIARYLDEHYPEHRVYPDDPEQLAQIEAMEAYADNQLVKAFAFGLFFQRVVKPMWIGSAGDEAVCQQALSQWIPDALDHLETLLPISGHVGAAITVADFMIGACLRAGMLGGWKLDKPSYPNLTNYLLRQFQLPAWQRIIALEAQIPELNQARQQFRARVLEPKT